MGEDEDGDGKRWGESVSRSDHGGLNQPDQYAGVEECGLQREELCNQR